ncbi:SDR family NAD(P)-dependent oxidoreductase [Georgenia sp. AZ-5]|uniref:SDR family NAD(P)-dependent oxidoreductase n=1 Tax=Georgenia sp. AZ-5 TaxID=3367526 RepID=UPI0037552059
MGTLSGKVVVVAGGAGAQGRVGAALFAGEGARVVVADASGSGATAVRDRIVAGGGAATCRQVDVGSEDDWATLVDHAVGTYGRLDGLVNYAAVLSRAGVEETEPEAWERTLRVNLTGAWLGLKLAVPAMRASGGGSIVNVGSVDALVGRGGGAAYQASKGGVRLLTKSAATQYAREGIRVNAVHPGPMEARMSEIVGPRADATATKELEARLVAQVPMGRLGRPADIAHAVRYLLSDESAFVTGIDLPVDGGLTAQ